MSSSKNKLATFSPAARRALAWKWCLIGFQLSGKKFNGESQDPGKHPAVDSLLRAEFDRAYDEDGR